MTRGQLSKRMRTTAIAETERRNDGRNVDVNRAKAMAAAIATHRTNSMPNRAGTRSSENPGTSINSA